MIETGGQTQRWTGEYNPRVSLKHMDVEGAIRSIAEQCIEEAAAAME
jgi:hypothetical protein